MHKSAKASTISIHNHAAGLRSQCRRKCRSLEETMEIKKKKDKDYKPEICVWRVGAPKTCPSQQVKALRTPWNQATVVELLDQQATN